MMKNEIGNACAVVVQVSWINSNKRYFRLVDGEQRKKTNEGERNEKSLMILLLKLRHRTVAIDLSTCIVKCLPKSDRLPRVKVS